MKLNTQEISLAFYENLDYFLNPSLDNIRFKEYRRKPSNVFFNRTNTVSRYILEKYIYKNFSHNMNCFYRLSNGEEIYGLSFHIVLYLIRIITRNEKRYDNVEKLLEASR